MRNDKLAELLDRREDGATLKMLDTDETIEVGIPTLKRWWKLVPTVAQDAPVESETVAEADNTPESETAATEAVEPQTKAQIESQPETQSDGESQDTPTEAQGVPGESETANEADNKPEAEKSSTESVSLSDVARKLEELFDTLNEIYYEGKLPRPIITIQSTPKFFGHCSTKQIWKSEGEAMYEINLGAEFLNRLKEHTAATLQHEMVHLYCRVNDIDETCQKGRYHNKTFKLEAEARGLIIGYNRTIGYSLTEPSEEFKQKLEEAGFDLSVPFCRETILAKKTGDREKPHKYVCPVCGQTVRSTGDLQIVCGICDEPMTKEI